MTDTPGLETTVQASRVTVQCGKYLPSVLTTTDDGGIVGGQYSPGWFPSIQSNME